MIIINIRKKVNNNNISFSALSSYIECLHTAFLRLCQHFASSAIIPFRFQSFNMIYLVTSTTFRQFLKHGGEDGKLSAKEFSTANFASGSAFT